MKRILFLLLIISTVAKAQTDDATKYVYYRFKYGNQEARGGYDSVFKIPLLDTIFKPSRAGGLTMRPADKKVYQWDGIAWSQLIGTGGGGGLDSLLSQYSVVGSGKSTNKFRLTNDTAIGTPANRLVYTIDPTTGMRHYDIVVPDTSKTVQIMKMATVDNVSLLRSSDLWAKGVKRMWTRGYYTIGDGGDARYNWVDTSTKADDSSFVIKPTGNAGNGRWEYASIDNAYNFLALGAKGDNSTDNYWTWTKFHNKMDSTTNPTLIIPTGNYYISKTLDYHKPINITGDLGSYFFIDSSKIGINIHGNYYRGYVPIIRQIAVYAKSKSVVDGRTVAGGTISNSDPSLFQYHGIYISSVVTLKDVTVGSFSGHGIRIYGSISDGSNASHVQITGGKVENCDGAGIYVSGPDANQCVMVGVDIRDNQLCGAFDESYLGNQWIGCMAHHNGYYNLGHYRATNVNARTSFVNCYGESQPAQSYVALYSSIVGGEHEEQAYGEGQININNRFNHVNVSTGQNPNFNLNLTSSENPSKVWLGMTAQNGGESWQLIGQDSSKLYLTQKFNGNDEHVWDIVGHGNSVFKYFPGTGNGFRYIYGMSGVHSFRNLFIGGRAFTGQPTNDLYGLGYQPGDVSWNKNFDGTNPESYMVVAPGLAGNSIPTSYTEGLTIKGNGDQYWQLSGATSVLKPGDAITVNGTTASIVDINYLVGGTYYLKMTKTLPSTGGTFYSIAYATSPIWRAQGRGVGNSSQMTSVASALTSNDAGWPFYNTDSLKTFWWTGSAFASISGGSGGTPSLTQNYIGVGNASNQLSGSSAFTFDGASLKAYNSAGTATNAYIQSNAANVGLWLGLSNSTTGTGKYSGIYSDPATDKTHIVHYSAGSGTGIERITMTADDKIGLNTTGPYYALDIAGQTMMIRGASNKAIIKGYNLGSGTAYGQIEWDLNTDKFNLYHYVGGAANIVQQFANTGAVRFPYYGTGARTGTLAYTLGVDASGNVIEITGGGGGTTTNAVTFNNSGSGAASGATFDGSVAKTISYNTIGAQPTLVSATNIKTVNGNSLLGSGDLSTVKNLSSQYTDASNTSTTETDLLSYTLPANTLANNGDRIVIEAVFTTPANSDSKDLKFYFGASTQEWASSTIASGVTIKVKITIIKTGVNSQRQIREFYTGFTEIPGYTTSGESDTGTILMKFTGTCAASSDITQRTMTVTYYPN